MKLRQLYKKPGYKSGSTATVVALKFYFRSDDNTIYFLKSSVFCCYFDAY